MCDMCCYLSGYHGERVRKVAKTWVMESNSHTSIKIIRKYIINFEVNQK